MEDSALRTELELPADYDPTQHGLFQVLDPKAGDYKLLWDRTKPAEVEEARRTFDSLRKKGYTAFHVKGKDGSQGEVMREFDPDAERLIMTLPIAGG